MIVSRTVMLPNRLAASLAAGSAMAKKTNFLSVNQKQMPPHTTSSHKTKRIMILPTSFLILLMAVGCQFTQAYADDGYRLWMRYDPIPDSARLSQCRNTFAALLIATGSPTEDAIKNELLIGIGGLTKGTIPLVNSVDHDGILVIGTPQNSPLIASLPWVKEIEALGPEGYSIRSIKMNGHAVTVIASTGKLGELYGSFDLLRRIQTGLSVTDLAINEQPKLKLRLLNHWDNLNGKIPNGYSGKSIWTWSPTPLDESRVRDYARANASIGINGTVLNDVNANSLYLDAKKLKRVQEIAKILRPYGIRVYLSAKFSAPVVLGGLNTADPLDSNVIVYWKKKADEIYALIPDFGGFLVKANSEGQPGPLTYHRTHADGANMLGNALAPHGGIVIWRTFVYDKRGGGRDGDRTAQAYDQLHGFDGHFASNVMLQVKNGPIDFQPREPFNPLFGAMPKTPLMAEVQIVQEYTGEGKMLVYLGTMWKEFLQADTFAQGPGSTVTKVLEGQLSPQKLTGMAGVANVSDIRNWCEHPFAQANWYAFGRLAWNPELGAEDIAREWVHMTFKSDTETEQKIVKIMMESHEAFVSYETPIGLTHLMGHPSHYVPKPSSRMLYHCADKIGLGFDRTSTGSTGIDCYQSGARDLFANLKTCPENLLLWFHHIPWDHRMASGKTMWDELCLHYQSGVNWVHQTRKVWDGFSGTIDPEQQRLVAQLLAIQEKDAEHWRNVCLTYFQTFSKRPYPDHVKVIPEEGH
ncbi:MAG: alpha-glucuronidase family glycosyl hydrolase [Verrucomicrobiota bacterium]